MTMTRKELAEQQAKIAQQIEESFKSDVATWIARGEDLAKESGLSMHVFVERYALNAKANVTRNASTPKRGVAPALYAHPSSDQTWSGKGRMPSWLQELLADGWTLETLRVGESSAQTNGAHA